MNGSKMTTQRKAILAAAKNAPPGGDYVWDGKDEGERPLSREEMQKGVEAYRKNAKASSAVAPGGRFSGLVITACHSV